MIYEIKIEASGENGFLLCRKLNSSASSGQAGTIRLQTNPPGSLCRVCDPSDWHLKLKNDGNFGNNRPMDQRRRWRRRRRRRRAIEKWFLRFLFCFVFVFQPLMESMNPKKKKDILKEKKNKKTFHCCSGFQLVTRIWFHFNFMLAIFPLSSILFLSFLSIVSIQTRPRITINNCYYYKYIQNIVLFPVNLIELIIHVPAHWGLSIHFCSTFHRCVINCHFAVCAVVILTFTPIMNVMSQHCWAIDISPPLLPDVKRNKNKKNKKKI